MASQFMDKLRNFLGIRQEPPRNEFRNPIWGSDDDDDGDELYTKQNINIYTDPLELHREFTKQMHDMFKTVGNMFGDMKSFFDEDHFHSFTETGIMGMPFEHENFDSGNLRDFYLKPGYRSRIPEQPKEDIDLDGKISSNEISGLLKRKEDGFTMVPSTPFNGVLVPGSSFCQTVITTTIKKPDGTVETRRIVKKGNEVIEETTTTTEPDVRGPIFPGLNHLSTSGFNNVLSDITSLFRNFN